MPAPTKYLNSTHYLEFQVTAANVVTNDTAVPVCFKLPVNLILLANRVDGLDIVVTLEDGTLIPRELSNFSKVLETGTIYCQDPAQSTVTGGTALYVQVGGASVNVANSTAVWSDAYGGAVDAEVVYHGEEGASNWTDSTANGYTGTNTGVAAGAGMLGVCGDWESTDGADAISNATAGNWEYSQAWTASMWIKRETNSGIVAMELVSKITSSGDSRGWAWYYGTSTSAGRFAIILTNDNSPIYRAYRLTDNAYDGTDWQGIAASNDGSGNASGLLVYVAGSAVAITTITDNLGGKTITNEGAFSVGSRDNCASNPYDGLIDEVRIWKAALAAEQIATAYNIESQWATNGAFTVGSLNSFTNNSILPLVIAHVFSCTSAI
jgi:hypothetical protein